ncbi:MAG: hypothetical protein ONB05_08010 [candidate division KSB1 bacterium]|nr:hypothetical protein [candidate division KSB1 bacterium]
MAKGLENVSLVWAVVVAVAGYVGMIIWAWLRPKKYIYAGAPDTKLWRDLRIWATLWMIIQIVLYIVFGA